MLRRDLADVCARYAKVFSGQVADVLDARGLTKQVVDGSIQGLTLETRVAGPAFTCKGATATELEPDDWAERTTVLDSMTPHCVAVVDTSRDTSSAYWGELMSTAAMGRDCSGVVIDNATRDVTPVLAMGFSVFTRFRSPASSIRRWRISSYNHPMMIGGVLVHLCHGVHGDADGAVTVPDENVIHVLEEVELLESSKSDMRRDLPEGMLFSEAFDRHQVG
jgi:4-hydroxy-4-methyl-2-oxoglutarate aldolase